MFKNCESFLSIESIQKVVCGIRCSKHNCIQNISPNYQQGNYCESFQFVQSLRTDILARSKEERASKIYEMLKGFYYYLVLLLLLLLLYYCLGCEILMMM